jgi:acyl carrier protein
VCVVTRPEILVTLVRLARKTFDEDDLDFSERTTFEEIDAWDSLNHMHMVVAMEKAFSIRFDLGELKRLVHVSDLVDIIEQKHG